MLDFEIRGDIIFKNNLWKSQMICQVQGKFDAFLMKEGINQNMTVGLAMERTPILLISIMSLLNQGILFFPINKEVPPKRLQYMLATADVDCVITDGDWIKEMNLDCPITFFDIEKNDISMDKHINQKERKQELAYLLFTSGTTGKPKAVEVLRSGLINFIQAIMKRIEFPEETRIICCTNEMFDIFFLESVLALHTGMTVVLADENERKNPKKICNLLLEQKVNALQMTPSFLQMIHIVDREYCCLKNMDVIMVGGETFPVLLLERLKSLSRARIYNMYGPTETTIWSLVADLSNSTEIVIGQPIAKTEVFIINDQEEIVQEGVEGEICIAGAGLARGYRNNGEQTDVSFKCLSLGGKKIRVYKTGDIGYKRLDGNYVCLGRKDTQVKILGHRIELEEIEQCVREISYIEDAESCVYDDQNVKKIICFYLSDEVPCIEDIREKLADKLPSYMFPATFVKVDNFIYTVSSKLDRNAMLHRYFETLKGKTEKEKVKKNDVEGWVKQSLSIFCGLEEERIMPRTSIESLGMDSLMYINFIVQSEDELKIEVDDEYLASDSFSTVGDIIEYFCKLCGSEIE